MAFASPARSDALPRKSQARLVAALVACTLVPSLSQSVIIPALPQLAAALHVSLAGAVWTVTAYLLTASAGTPLVGRIGDGIGVRRTMLGVLAVYVAGSVLALLATSLAVMIVARLLQGVVGGTFALSIAITRRALPGDAGARTLGLLSGTVAVGTALGFVLGGVLTDHGGFRAIFWLGLAVAAVAGALAIRELPESPPQPAQRIDFAGGALLVVGVALSLVGVSRANVVGWTSPQTLGLIVAGLVVLAVWAAIETRVPAPLLDISLLTNQTARLANLATFCIGWAMFGLFVLTPQLAHDLFGLDATGAGALLAPGALLMLIAGPLAAALGRRRGDRLPLGLGTFIAGLGLLCLAFDHGHVAEVIAFSVVTSIGIGVAFPSMPSLVSRSAGPEHTGQAVGFNSLMRGVGSSVGAQVSATIIASSGEAGFTVAYVIAAAAALVGTALALAIPSGPASATEPEILGPSP
jgi:EmrB/QacA subfamily drug resistance transporter